MKTTNNLPEKKKGSKRAKVVAGVTTLTLIVVVSAAGVVSAQETNQGFFAPPESQGEQQRDLGQRRAKWAQNKDNNQGALNFFKNNKGDKNKAHRPWQKNRGDKPELTEEQKAQFEEIKNLMMSGEYEAARDLAEQYGINKHFKGHQVDPEKAEQHKAAMEALKAGDYDAWKAASVDHPQSENITEENFAEFAAKAQERFENGDHKRGPKPFKHAEDRTAVKDALAANDYQAFVTAFGEDSQVSEKIDEEKFAQLVERYNNRPEDRPERSERQHRFGKRAQGSFSW